MSSAQNPKPEAVTLETWENWQKNPLRATSSVNRFRALETFSSARTVRAEFLLELRLQITFFFFIFL